MLRLPTRFLACLLACAWSTQLVAAVPTITSLSVRGLQVGGTTRVVIRGTNLLPSPRIVAGIKIARQVVVGEVAANVLARHFGTWEALITAVDAAAQENTRTRAWGAPTPRNSRSMCGISS